MRHSNMQGKSFLQILAGYSKRPGMYTIASSSDGMLGFLDGLCLLADQQDVESFENWLRARYGFEGRAVGLSGLLQCVVELRPGKRSDELDCRSFFAIIEAYVAENVQP